MMQRSNNQADLKRVDASLVIRNLKDSGCFGRSDRQLKLFEYLLRKSLSGKFSDVSQYCIAIDVLDRPSSFDATSDSIVRVEMHRLRANIQAYNAGGFDYTITVPAASFQVIVKPVNQGLFSNLKPKFISAGLASLVAMIVFCAGYMTSGAHNEVSNEACSKLVPNIRIDYMGKGSEAQIYTETVLRAAITQQTSFNLLKENQNCSDDAAPVFSVQLSTLEQDSQFNLAIEVVEFENEAVVDSYHISGAIADANENTQLYYEIVETANSIAMPDSTLARFAYKSRWASAESQRNYGCLIAMYDSFSGELSNEFVDIHSCLEESVASGSAALDNYGALASSYLAQAREIGMSSVSEPLNAAKAILDEYEGEWINSSELAIARMYYEFGRTDVSAERMEQVLTTTYERYNTNPQILLTVAPSYGFSLGRWDYAKEISDRAKLIYSRRDQSVYHLDAGYAFLKYTDTKSIEPCFKLYSESSTYVNILVNACAYLVNDQNWIETTEANLLQSNINGVTEKVAFLNGRIQDRRFMSKIRDVFELSDGL